MDPVSIFFVKPYGDVFKPPEGAVPLRFWVLVVKAQSGISKTDTPIYRSSYVALDVCAALLSRSALGGFPVPADDSSLPWGCESGVE